MQTNLPVLFDKGIDRTLAPMMSSKGSFYILRNLRHRFDQRGAIQQTPYFYDYQTFARGTYYNAGSLTEPATSAIRLVTADLVVTDYVCRNTLGQVQVFYQTTVPTAETVLTGCRIVINNVAGLALTLGSTLDIVIEAAGNTFKWRKNGGAYTLGLACTITGTSIDGGNATVYFLATSGFNPGDTWSWTRTDASFANPLGTFTYPSEYEYYKGDLYFVSVDERMMVFTKDAQATPINYVISVGYRPVVGSYFTFFDDHLVVTWYDTAQSGWTSADGNSRVVGWSDKGDVHNFIATDTNEADRYTLPNVNQFDNVNTTASFLMGIASIQGQLFLFTNNEIYWTTALGLPLVFSFQKLMNVKLITGYSAIIKCDFGVYVLGFSDVYFFDGSSLRSIGKPIVQGTPNDNFDGSFGAWDPYLKELNIVLGTLLYVYQEKWDTWYVRYVNFDANAQSVTCINCWSRVVVGIASLKLRREDTVGTSQPIYDSSNGTAYATPYLVTQIYGDDLATIKQITAVYLGALTNSTGVSATYYTTGSSVVVQLSYWQTPGGDFYNVSETIPTGATWNSGKPDGIISVRTAFRGLALSLSVQGTASKPPAFFYLNQLVPLITNAEQQKVTR